MEDATEKAGLLGALTCSKMGIAGANRLVGTLDGMMSPKAVLEALYAQPACAIVVAGDWRPASKAGLDAYDLALKFAEDNYVRIRATKSDQGWYVVVADGRM